VTQLSPCLSAGSNGRYPRHSEVFVITGIYGILTEEVGQVFLRIFRVPVIGLLYALIVSFVYGIFPMLAYMVSEEKIRTAKRLSLLVRSLIAAVALFVEWAVYGLFVMPALKRAFQVTCLVPDRCRSRSAPGS
jgi:hypothetical protein